MRIGVLDYAVIDEGQTATEAMQVSIQLAQLAEALGYTRFWFAEHHDVPALANSSPELMMMHALNQTTHIRIGSGGIMLPHYPVYKVAEWIQTLHTFFPNRVDIGLGNNPGTHYVREVMQTHLLNRHEYDQHVAQLTQHLSERSTQHMIQPCINHDMPLWLLSAGEAGATLAATLGHGYVYGLFLNQTDAPLVSAQQHIALYRILSQQNGHRPYTILAVFTLVAPTQAEATQWLRALDVWLLGKEDFSEFKQFPSVDTATHYQWDAVSLAQCEQNRRKVVYGDQYAVKQQLDQLVAQLQVDELMVIPLAPSVEARATCLHLIAKMYQLTTKK